MSLNLTTLIQIIALGLLQGVAELFPISSLGHTVIIPGLLGWGNLIEDPSFLPLVVTLHLGTAIALLTFFWRDWVALTRAFIRTSLAGRLDADPQGRTISLLIAGTIPTGLIALAFQSQIQALFFSSPLPVLPAAFLALNGAILFAGERLRQRHKPFHEPLKEGTANPKQASGSIQDLTFPQAILIGLAQSTALIPGISRSGITMVAGMGVRLSHEQAARFAFLLATPLIFLAGADKLPDLFKARDHAMLLYAIIGGVVAGLAAWFSVKFLMRYFEVGRLTPFAYYCLVAGASAFLLLAFGIHA
jgi:undecaprenyl-diphosphatase